MGLRELSNFRDAEELAASAAQEFLAFCGNAEASALLIALPGGRIAGRFFSVLADQARQHRTRLDRVHFFWGDERCVPPEDPESNFGLAHDRLLTPLEIPADRIHRIRGELAPPEAVRQATAELRRMAPVAPAGQPVLDLVLLGMGEDGHVASLFPEEGEGWLDDPAVFRAVLAPKPPPARITLGYRTIQAARQVWVLASGPGKERALETSLSPSGRTPLARVLARSPTRIWTDIPLPAE